MRLGQFNDYLSKSAHIFVSKLRIFDERGTETTRDLKNFDKEFQIASDLYDTNAFDNYCPFWYYSSEFGYLLQKD